jgi:hypothetical protein
MSLLSILRPRSISRSVKLVVTLLLVAFAIVQLLVLYNQNQEEKKATSEHFAQLVKAEKLKAHLARQQPSHAYEDGEGVSGHEHDVAATLLINNAHFQYKVGVTKVDWHDWEQIGAELKRNGTGEQGVGVVLQQDEMAKSKPSYNSNGFNGYVSDKIALDRAVCDIRHPM